MTYRQAIRAALRDELMENPLLTLMGEDVGVYGGCFKVTEGLWAEFPSQVVDTPVSEEGFAGLAVGAAAMGVPMVLEIMYADFFTLISDPIINHAAKMHFMSGGQFNCPIVLRLPEGGGTGHGPQHTQSPEAAFLGFSGLKIVAPSDAESAYFLLREAVKDPNPVLFFEHKMLYGVDFPFEAGSESVNAAESGDAAQRERCGGPALPFEEASCRSNEGKPSSERKSDTESVSIPQIFKTENLSDGGIPANPEARKSQRPEIGRARILQNGNDITIVSYSRATRTAMETADLLAKKGIGCTVVDLGTLKPLDTKTILESVRKTGRVAIIQDPSAFGGIANAISAAVTGDKDTFRALKTSPVIISGRDTPIPFSKSLEETAYPCPDLCVNIIERALLS